MGELVEGNPAAKSLGIYLGQLYGWVKQGKLKNHKKDGKYVTPDGKGLIVDIEEARAVWMSSKKKAKTPGEPRAKKARAKKGSSGEEGEVGSDEPRVRQLKAGTIVSYENGRDGRRVNAGKPHYTVAQVLASTGRLTFLDDGNHRRTYDGTTIDNTVFLTERLSTMMAKGVCRIEHPTQVLGMVLLSFIMDDKIDLAQSLENWLIKNDLSVIVPEIMDLEDEPDEVIVRGKPVMIEEEDRLAGEEDNDDDDTED